MLSHEIAHQFFVEQDAGKPSLDDQPYQAESDGKNLPTGRYVPLNRDKLLQQ
ncbi:MAG: hypothetical protein M0P59_10860 [Gallionella sp.]|jgi:hypothetical protein|nr:hypothetical protein [Gallionella sp.]MCK9354648.1 hypothetical protein [Gallionella sp.]